MPVDANVLDAIARNRIDVLRWAQGEAQALVKMLADEDAKLADLLRRRLPGVKAGDARSPSAKALMQDVADLRRESLRAVKAELQAAMQEFAVREGAVAEKMLSGLAGVDLDAATVSAVKAAVAEPFSMADGVARTLNQWMDDLVRADRSRRVGALQAGIRADEADDALVRRIIGTRAAKYSDGLAAQTRRNLDALVRTAVDHSANAALLALGEANEGDGAIVGFVWTTMLDGHVCAKCARENGRFIPGRRKTPPRGMLLTRHRHGPPLHARCRCFPIPVFDKRALARRIEEDA